RRPARLNVDAERGHARTQQCDEPQWRCPQRPRTACHTASKSRSLVVPDSVVSRSSCDPEITIPTGGWGKLGSLTTGEAGSENHTGVAIAQGIYAVRYDVDRDVVRHVGEKLRDVVLVHSDSGEPAVADGVPPRVLHEGGSERCPPTQRADEPLGGLLELR